MRLIDETAWEAGSKMEMGMQGAWQGVLFGPTPVSEMAKERDWAEGEVEL